MQNRPVPEDPVVLRSPAMMAFFDGVMQRQMRCTFRAVHLARPGVPNLPSNARVVIYSNHPSWWDPAFYIVLAKHLFSDHESYGPMEMAALERYRFMRRIGIFGVQSGTRAGAARFLQVGAHILANPDRMLWMTAQGQFVDPRVRPVTLRPGLAHLLRRVPGAIAVPLALEYPFWSEKRPEALAAFGQPVVGHEHGDSLATQLDSALERTQDNLAKLSRLRDPSAFDCLIGGRAGVGGVYGGWLRLKTLAKGRDHQPDHAIRSTAGKHEPGDST